MIDFKLARDLAVGLAGIVGVILGLFACLLLFVAGLLGGAYLLAVGCEAILGELPTWLGLVIGCAWGLAYTGGIAIGLSEL